MFRIEVNEKIVVEVDTAEELRQVLQLLGKIPNDDDTAWRMEVAE